MRYLITGCEGFLGSHLADSLVAQGGTVFGSAFGDVRNLRHLGDRINLLRGDLRERDWVSELLVYSTPDVVFHLAAQSFVTVSWQRPEETLSTNIVASLNLLDAIVKLGIDPVVVVISSSAVFGPRPMADMPLREDYDFRPTSVYAVSKVGEEMVAYFFGRVHRLRVIRVRPFNMTGPRKRNDVCSDFARGIAETQMGRRRVLYVGNLQTVRDFTDGRDGARALIDVAEKGVAGEVYNLCSGHGHRVGDVLSMLIELSGIRIKYETVPEKMRPFDDPVYVGDNSKIRQLGWEPKIPLKQTLIDLLQYWRAELSSSTGSYG